MIKYINKNNNVFMVLTGIFIITGLIFNQLFLLIGGIIGGIPIFVKAIEALKVKVISIDLLVSIAIIGGLLIGEYEESSVVSFLFLFGTFLEQKTLKKTRNAIKQLVNLAPKTAYVKLSNNEIKKIDIDNLKLDDVVMVKPGGQIPVDGKIVKGDASVNQSAITGESQPINVTLGDDVFAGSIVDNGSVEIKVTKIGDETTLGKIIELVEEAQDSKSPAEKFIDKFATYYTPAVLIIALIIFIISKDIKLAITILVLGCPGALVIGAPVSIVAGIGNGANRGVLLQGGDTISQMAKIKIFAFDKTNTLTKGKMVVSEVKEYSKLTNDEKNIISSIENESDHPLSKVLVDYFNGKINKVNVKTIKGQGLIYENILIGNLNLMTNNQVNVSEEQLIDLKNIQSHGSSTVMIAMNKELKMTIGISDVLKDDAKKALINLKKLGAKKTVILSGDNQSVVDFVAKELGTDENYGELLPEDKLNFVKKMQKNSKIAFIGDGINDSPTLAAADIGIAMGNGTDVAMETSDIVLANSKLSSLVYAYAISKKTLQNEKQNIFIAILTVVLLLVGLVFGIVNMASGMLFHEFSILLVIMNAMRLIKEIKI
ncbi:heavy metal translocating P-type ATPase [Companilactobacillus sp. DQM5]|uniref:heavy metal translocating P-type ATPase n=1 Tax=Companilactobacillus sp. DQM5 TaxID=3463359 RepID=UPI004058CCC0